jgi:hypothetical protein
MADPNVFMNNPVKLQLSKEEMELVTNTEWILTKHRVIKKVYQMFGQINEMMKGEVLHSGDLFPRNLKYQTGRISKGENYQQLPYVILDYPSSFVKNNIFTVRSMFWWGNFFSITLHLSGYHKTRFINNKPAFLSFLKRSNFFICINEEEWQHHFEEENYALATTITDTVYNQVMKRDFIKVAKKLPLIHWDSACDFIMRSFGVIIGLLQINYQEDKKDLLPWTPIIGSDL